MIRKVFPNQRAIHARKRRLPQQAVTLYFAKTATGSWSVYGTDGTTGTPVGPGANGLLANVTFNASRQITSPSATTFAISIPNTVDNGGTTRGTLQSGAVEKSNVELTNQLVDLITAQRNYQAKAQTIKTQRTVDQTLINL